MLSRSQFDGRIDSNAFAPRSKKSFNSKVFLNIGRADELGSGVRNLYEYTRIYSCCSRQLFVDIAGLLC